MELTSNILNRSVPVTPNPTEAEFTDGAVRTLLRHLFPDVVHSGPSGQQKLHQEWSARHWPEVKPDFLWELWSRPVGAVQADHRIFFTLPGLLAAEPREIYNGKWLNYWNTLQQSGFRTLCEPAQFVSAHSLKPQHGIDKADRAAALSTTTHRSAATTAGIFKRRALNELIEIRKGKDLWTLTRLDTQTSYTIVPGKWDASTDRALKDLWKDSRLSASMLASTLGFFRPDGRPQKNAVIGKAGRLGLSRSEISAQRAQSAPPIIRRPLTNETERVTAARSPDIASASRTISAPRLHGGVSEPASMPKATPSARARPPQTNAAAQANGTNHVTQTDGPPVPRPVPLLRMKDQGDVCFDNDRNICTRMEENETRTGWLRCTGILADRRFCQDCIQEKKPYMKMDENYRLQKPKL